MSATQSTQTVPAAPCRMTGVSHFGIQVDDLERSLVFYRDLLGLEQIAHWQKDEEYNQRVVGYPGVTLNMAVLKLPFPHADGFLELIEYQNVERTPIDARTANPGTAHICFYVDDLDAVYARLTAAGIGSNSEVIAVSTGPVTGAKVVYMIDPDGFRVELLETSMTLAGVPRDRT
jgi:lactoylglutathione lyase